MSLSMRIAAHLPYLRRFSRAVTGSQASGDAYVAAVLEALIADISLSSVSIQEAPAWASTARTNCPRKGTDQYIRV